MRIGKLSQQTGVAPRMLRYYEEQGLISPRRLENGYRVYDHHLVDRVRTIRGLIEAGIATRDIASVLPCLADSDATLIEDAAPDRHRSLKAECDRMSEKIDFLTKNRDALTAYLRALEEAALDARAARHGTVD